MIIASCGHEITNEWSNNSDSLIEYTEYENDENVIVSAVVCSDCLKNYLTTKSISNEKEYNDALELDKKLRLQYKKTLDVEIKNQRDELRNKIAKYETDCWNEFEEENFD